jgi:hypothetical protein
MVHALQEAHRVLVPHGTLIDLRPAGSHRRAGLGFGRSWRLVGTLRESLDEDYAADAAIEAVVRRGLFRQRSREHFDLDRVMDTLAEFRLWIEDFSRLEKYGDHARLIKRLERALARATRRPKLTVRGRMTLGVLEKL